MSVPQVLGPYQLKAQLAVGGQSEVWLGVRMGPGGFQRRCAVKLLLAPTCYDESSRKAFIAEARLMAQFDHDNLVAVTDLGEDRETGAVYTVMPYVSGMSLASIVREKNVDTFDVLDGIWIITRVLLALDFAHKLQDERGRKLEVIHRDVSPENVLIGFDGQIRLIDFGIALSSINPRNTRLHVVKGKLDFLSPEQAAASPRIDHTTDIYSAGLLLYFLLTGINPLEGDTETALERARNPRFPPITDHVNVPAELAHTIHAMLEPLPAERPQDARAIAKALMKMLHKLDANYDAIVFAENVRKRLKREYRKEQKFLQNLGDGTQIIDADDLANKPSRRRDETTPILDTRDILSAEPSRRQTGTERTRDDLADILAELEEIYDD